MPDATPPLDIDVRLDDDGVLRVGTPGTDWLGAGAVDVGDGVELTLEYPEVGAALLTLTATEPTAIASGAERRPARRFAIRTGAAPMTERSSTRRIVRR